MNENDEAIKKARKVLNDISQDKYEREMAELRLKYVMEMKAEKQYGYDIGLKDGITQGIEQGSEQTKIEIAKKMKTENLDINVIVSITGLTKEEIEKL